MYKMDNNILTLLENASQKYGVPMTVLYPIVMTESGGNTNQRALTPTEDSRGLFQVNLYSNPNANSSQLFNPQYNIDYMLPTIKKSYDEAVSKGLTGKDITLYVEKNAERPQWTDTVVSNITKYFNDYTGSNSNTTTSTAIPTNTVTDIMGGSTVNNIFSSVKFGFVYIILVLVLLFSLYIVFLSKGGK